MSTHSSKDRASLCSFSCADGRRCRTPRCSAHPHFCYFHARKEAQALAAQQVDRDISSCLSKQLSLRLRPQLGFGPSLFRRRPGSDQTQNRYHPHLPRPNLVQSIHLAQPSTLTPFRINTCKSVSKKRTLTPFRMNTYEKPGEGGRRLRVATPVPCRRSGLSAPTQLACCHWA
jgi:hypothetical protein